MFMRSTNTLGIEIAGLLMFNMSNLGSHNLLQSVVSKAGRPHMVHKAEARDSVGAYSEVSAKNLANAFLHQIDGL